MSANAGSSNRSRSRIWDFLLGWSRTHSFRYFSVKSGCCGDEILETESCRYDFERFGCVPVKDARHADLLIIQSVVSEKGAAEIKRIYDSMPTPRYVMAVGACACSGGLFHPGNSYSVVPGVDKIVPVDVFVPGCPPRPEAVMNGLVILQERIRGQSRFQSHA